MANNGHKEVPQAVMAYLSERGRGGQIPTAPFRAGPVAPPRGGFFSVTGDFSLLGVRSRRHGASAAVRRTGRPRITATKSGSCWLGWTNTRIARVLRINGATRRKY